MKHLLLPFGGGKIKVRIETKRLILRDLQLDDAPYLAKRIAPLNVSRYLAVVPHPYNLADAKDFLKNVIANQAKEPREGYELAVTMKNGCIA